MSSLLILLSLAGYGALHSLLAAQSVKAWARRRLGPRIMEGWYRLAYNALAGLGLMPVLGLVVGLPDGAPLWRFPAWLAAVSLTVQAAALAGAVYSLWRTDLPRFIGLRQAARYLRGEAEPRDPPALHTGGLHGWVRHPLYFLSLVFIWLIPVVTPNLLALDLGLTLYFYLGSIFEERKLVAEFGDAYRAHQARVPRLIPWPRRRPPAGRS